MNHKLGHWMKRKCILGLGKLKVFILHLNKVELFWNWESISKESKSNKKIKKEHHQPLSNQLKSED